jgi:transcriptional regulator with XRE-family HTH domain
MFGNVVRGHRRRLGLTQEELAHRAGIGLRTVRDIEVGRISRPRQATVRRLADVFELRGAQRDQFHELAASADELTGEERCELVALRQDRNRLAAENEILRRAAGYSASDRTPVR